jgi:putative ABC transport system permease protein
MNYVLVRFKSGHLTQTVAGFKKLFKKTIPNSVFEYTFLDKYLNTLYAADQQMARIILIFSILAIMVASLGLFGLTSYMTEQRTKEIGIRKVLGASVTGIVAMLSKDFLKLVGLGFLIAIPIAWYAMHRWLQNFAYHIHIGIGVFLLAGILAMIIALATVSWQSIRAALMNPVESLRNE